MENERTREIERLRAEKAELLELLLLEPDNQTVQQCCICYGGNSFPGPMKEALKCHLSILKYKSRKAKRRTP